MEYKLYVQRIEPLTAEEKEEVSRKKSSTYVDYSAYPEGVGFSKDTKLIPVLDVVLTEEEYNRAKSAIIQSKN